MKIKKAIKEAVAAAFGGIWIQSFEHEDAARAIAESIKEHGWKIITWDPEYGTQTPGKENGAGASGIDVNPITALNTLRAAQQEDGHVLLLMRNLHPYLAGPDCRIINPALLQTIQHIIELGASAGVHIIVLSYPGVKLPVEIEKMFYVIEHELPDAEELWQLILEVEDDEKNLPARNSPEGHKLVESANGLTRIEASNAFALSVAREKTVKPATIWELKEQMLKKSGLIEMRRPKSGFDMLGGMGNIKQFILDSLVGGDPDPKAAPLGLLLTGLPGSGKSALVDAIGYEVDLPVLDVNIGNLQGGIVGQSEAQTRMAINQIKQMRPCIVRLEEIEKMFAGAGGGSLDSGVSDRQFGAWLTFMQERPPGIYMVATCNDVSRLLQASAGAFARAERFDAMFFMDVPTKEQRDAIWPIYFKYFGIDAAQPKPNDENWTGAEIKSCCRLSKLLHRSLIETAKMVVPVAVTSKEQIAALKEWAHHRCLSDTYAGVYDRNGDPAKMAMVQIDGARRRKVIRGR